MWCVCVCVHVVCVHVVCVSVCVSPTFQFFSKFYKSLPLLVSLNYRMQWPLKKCASKFISESEAAASIATTTCEFIYCRTQNVSGHFNLANYSESILSLTFSNANKNVLML